MIEKNLELMEGQAGRLTFDIVAPEGTEATLQGAVRVRCVDYPMQPEPGDPHILYIGAMASGSYLYEVRCNGETALYGYVEVKPSPLGDVNAIKDWRITHDISQTVAKTEIHLAPGPRGPRGEKGDPGEPGAPGESLYDEAVKAGYEGTKEEWVAGALDINASKEAAALSASTASAHEAASKANSEAAANKAAEAEKLLRDTEAQAKDAAASAAASAAFKAEAKVSADASEASNVASKKSADDSSASATASEGSAQRAATSESNAAASESKAAASETHAREHAGASESSAARSEASAVLSEASATRSDSSAARADERATAAGVSAEASLKSANEAASEREKSEAAARSAEETKKLIDADEADYAAHIKNTSIHLTPEQAALMKRIEEDFPEVTPDSPGTPEPALPAGALSYDAIREHFSKNAQPGTVQAPPAVYISRVPYARKDESGAWVNNDSVVNEAVFSATRKFMDNALLEHACSTDAVEGKDDYAGKLWPFYWARGNYEDDAYGVKHITSIQGQTIDGVSFDPSKPVATFGPAFYYFVKPEKYQNPETLTWATSDGTEEGTPLFQLWGISARAWADLDEGRQAELAAHGIGEEDFNLWPECQTWDAENNVAVMRPHWVHSAYCGAAEQMEDGSIAFVSKPNLPLYNGLSHNSLNALYSYKAGFGGSACVQSFGALFDIVKNAEKNSQKLHSGMSGNNCSAVLAEYSTVQADYIFPIAAQGNFRIGCTVWLWQTNTGSTGTTYRRSHAVQIGRIASIETRSFALADGSTAESLCLVFDPETVKPFIVKTGTSEDAATKSTEAIAAAKELTDAGIYACCYATQGMALTGETDAVIGRHDGARTSLTDGRHPYRVMGTEYMPGVWLVAADVTACKGDGSTSVTIGGQEITPDSSQYVILQAPFGVARRSSGNLANFIASGYVAVGLAPTTGGFILNVEMSDTGVIFPIAAGGTGSGDSKGHGDNFYTGASPAEFLCGGNLAIGGLAGSVCLDLDRGLGNGGWSIGGRA